MIPELCREQVRDSGGTKLCSGSARCYIKAFKQVKIGRPIEHYANIRRHACKWYDMCLQYAAHRKWGFFSCHECTSYAASEERPELTSYTGLLKTLQETVQVSEGGGG